MNSTEKKNHQNKLIVLLNLSGSYKGGAQRRYLSLFKYFQQIARDDYFLLLNDSLYSECIKDRILVTSKNIFVISIHYGKKKIPQKHNSFNNKIVKPSIHSLRKQKIYNSLGLTSSFLKQFRSWINYSFNLLEL